MADIEFDCPSCKERIVADALIIGREAHCPHCDSAIFIKDASTVLLAGRALCLSCKADIPKDTVFCPKCGASQTVIQKPAATDQKTCLTCGGRIDSHALVCPKCKTRQAVDAKPYGTHPPPRSRAPGMGF